MNQPYTSHFKTTLRHTWTHKTSTVRETLKQINIRSTFINYAFNGIFLAVANKKDHILIDDAKKITKKMKKLKKKHKDKFYLCLLLQLLRI